MADVTVWLLANCLLIPPVGFAVMIAMWADCENRLVATQLAVNLAVLNLALMTFSFDQPSFIDLAVCLALLSVPSTYVFTMFMERWL